MTHRRKTIVLAAAAIAGALSVAGISFRSRFAIIETARSILAEVGSSVGVTVSVSSNPYNTLAQKLQEKESALNQQERELREREEIIRGERDRAVRRMSITGGAVGAIIVVLLAVNFYLDYRHRKTKLE